MEDQDLVSRALSDGPETFRPIVDRYQRVVFGIALSRLRDYHRAEDVAQQVFLEAFERLVTLRDPARLGPWLRSMTVHRCIDLQRAERENVDLDKVDEPASEEISPLEVIEQAELAQRVVAAIAGLPAAQRETATLFYLGEHSVQEIAAVQEVPVGTIKRRLHDARARLRKEMLEMVEATLPVTAPGKEFGDRVFDLLCRHGKPALAWPWPEVEAELRRIGGAGVEGFIRAMQVPHWPTRAFAVGLVDAVLEETRPGDDARSTLAEVLLQGLRDRNKRVRTTAAAMVLHLDLPEQTRRLRILPALVALLRDPTWRVRRRVAYELWDWAGQVPLAEVALALAVERHPLARQALAELARLAVARRVQKSVPPAEPPA